jgi:DNA-binding response OmpR family regulator
VVLVTSEAVDRTEALGRGASDVLSKPFNQAELRALVSWWSYRLGHPEPRARLRASDTSRGESAGAANRHPHVAG